VIWTPSLLCRRPFYYLPNNRLTHILSSITKQTGVKSKIPVKPPSAVKKVDVNNFDDLVLVRDNISLHTLIPAHTCTWLPLGPFQERFHHFHGARLSL
jgi:hypothetical protein